MCILVMARSIFSKIQYTIRSSPLRAGYGGSIKNSKSVVFSTLVIKVVNVISCCTGPYHNRTRLYFHITLCIICVCVWMFPTYGTRGTAIADGTHLRVPDALGIISINAGLVCDDIGTSIEQVEIWWRVIATDWKRNVQLHGIFAKAESFITGTLMLGANHCNIFDDPLANYIDKIFGYQFLKEMQWLKMVARYQDSSHTNSCQATCPIAIHWQNIKVHQIWWVRITSILIHQLTDCRSPSRYHALGIAKALSLRGYIDHADRRLRDIGRFAQLDQHDVVWHTDIGVVDEVLVLEATETNISYSHLLFPDLALLAGSRDLEDDLI